MIQDFKHKNFTGSCEVSIEDDCLHGRILFIEDIISYEGQTVSEIRAAFEEAVDDYLELCQQEGLEPNKPFSGSFNVRVGQILHRSCALAARRNNQGLNEFVTSALQTACSPVKVSSTESIHRITIRLESDLDEQVVSTSSSITPWLTPAESKNARH